jgi:uncharacterized protein (TIGR02246 family)
LHPAAPGAIDPPEEDPPMASPRTPEDCDHLFERHLNAGEVDAVAALYEPGASLINQDGTVAAGPTAIRAAIAAFAEMKPRLRMNIVKTVRVNDDLAVLYNDWTMTVPGPDNTPVEMAGKAVEVMRRQSDGTWRFAVDDPFARGANNR